MASGEAQLDIIVNAVDHASDQLKEIGSNAGAVFAGITVAAAAAGAAIAAFAVKGLEEFGEIGEDMAHMNEETGLSVQALSALNVVAQENGVSMDQISSAMKLMATNLSGVSPSASLARNALKGLGLNMEDLQKLNPEQQLTKLSAALDAVKDPTQKSADAVALFGRQGVEMIPIFEEMGGSLDGLKAKAADLGELWNDEKVSKAAKFDEAMADLKMSFQGIALEVGGKLAPVVTEFVSTVIPMLRKGFTDATETIGQFVQWLEQTGVLKLFQEALEKLWNTVANKLWPALQRLWQTLQPYLPYWKQFAELVGAILVAALLAAIDAINKAVAIITIAVDAYTAWAAGIQKFGQTVTAVWDGILSTVKTVIGEIESLVGKAIADWNNLVSTVSHPIKAAGNAIGGAVSAVTGFLSGRANGGDVTAGTPYIVGERGPELFVPQSFGAIVPSGAFGGISGGINVIINAGPINDHADARSLGAAVGDAIMSRLKSQLKI